MQLFGHGTVEGIHYSQYYNQVFTGDGLDGLYSIKKDSLVQIVKFQRDGNSYITDSLGNFCYTTNFYFDQHLRSYSVAKEFKICNSTNHPFLESRISSLSFGLKKLWIATDSGLVSFQNNIFKKESATAILSVKNDNKIEKIIVDKYQKRLLMLTKKGCMN